MIQVWLGLISPPEEAFQVVCDHPPAAEHFFVERFRFGQHGPPMPPPLQNLRVIRSPVGFGFKSWSRVATALNCQFLLLRFRGWPPIFVRIKGYGVK
jgi:hypothetical protein